MTTRNQSLDALRGVAILLVLAHHFPYRPFFDDIGWCGVDLFFVLSGFLISGLLFREYRQTQQLNVGRFLLRRGLKIWPALYVFLLIMAMPLLYRPGAWKSLLGSALFVSNFQSNVEGALDHTWSLSVEEHFYLLVPFLLLLLIRKQRLALLPWIGLGIGIVCLWFRMITPGIPSTRLSYCRFDSLFAGVVLAYLYYFKPAWFQTWGRARHLPVAALLVIAPFVGPVFWRRTVGLSAMAVGFSILLAWSVDRSPRLVFAKLGMRGVAAIGFYSYSIYLWHQPLTAAFMRQHLSFAKFCALMAISIVWGVIMAKLIEIPVLRLRDQLLPYGTTKLYNGSNPEGGVSAHSTHSAIAVEPVSESAA